IGPTWQGNYFLGADNQGRDVAARVLYGGRSSLEIGIASAAIACFLALVVGLVAGYFGGFVDSFLSRLMDLIWSFPLYLLATLIVLFPLMIATTILTESALSFLSIGVQAPDASWGTIIDDGQALLYTRPWVAIAPGIMIVLTVLALNVFGDGLRDALDPRAKVRMK